jgi:hypothetical protein
VVPPSQQLDISSMTVDDDYQGPRLEGGFRIYGPSQRGVCRAVCLCTTGIWSVPSSKQVATQGQQHILISLP